MASPSARRTIGKPDFRKRIIPQIINCNCSFGIESLVFLWYYNYNIDVKGLNNMGRNAISLRSVNELLGMNFFIPDYQRGYRWEKQQAIDLLEDIYSFATKTNSASEEIYCIQPLVVSEKADDILAKCKSPEATLEDIKKYIKGSWTVVDGQQRLTTIYLLLSCLGRDDRYEIDYCTRIGSKDFLKNIKSKTSAEADKNIDYYHMHLVYNTIKEWFDSKQDLSVKDVFLETLLNRVTFIWYQVNQTDEISVFTRLNIGKIPLTDSELIKALFLNRANFSLASDADKRQLESKQHKIALEWDQIEYALQNDEFWAFLHDVNYDKPTRIDFILDAICMKDKYGLYEDLKNYRNRGKNRNRDEARKYNEALSERIGNDDHKTFRYFNEAFIRKKENANNKNDLDWLDSLWKEVKKYYQVFTEWYQDYRLYHYIGYLTSVQGHNLDITDYVSSWDNSTKAEYIEDLKSDIATNLKKKEWISDIYEYKFDQEYNGKVISKRAVVDVLLLHNIETIIRQNEKLVSETKYNLPNFTKFPFHLYKREKWQVEHIRPNAGDDLQKEGADVLYLSLSRQYFTDDATLTQKIDDYLSNAKDKADFSDILTEILQKGGSLPDEDKNRIWNYVLLDESTNKEYGNQIFPVKRAFIANKEKGFKISYSYKGGKLIIGDKMPEVAFVPPCTKNVFSKFYTEMPYTMINWNTEDAEAYWNDIKEKLQYYFSQIGIA